jgi:tetratricopeptide (TPR) repeat protein
MVEAQMDEAPEVVKIRYLLERGRAYNSSGQAEKAHPLFVEAWEIAESSRHDFYAVDAAHMMGIIEEPEKALEWNEKALELAESSTDPKARKWLGSLYNNIGWTYHDQGEYEKALDLFERGLTWRQEQGQEKETRIAKWCVARALRSLERTEEALAMQEVLLAEWNEAEESSGYVYEELGGCHLELGDAEEAVEYFALAFEELSKDQWLAENQPDRLARLKELGGVE